MINEDLISELSKVTQEEQQILSGETTVNRTLYMSSIGNTINSKKILSDGKLISLRPHTRFVHFPKHTHNFIEVVYMCKGKTIHVINGEELTLKEGELLFLGQNATQEIMPASEHDIAVNFIVLPEFFNTSLTMIKNEDTPLKQFIVDSLKSNIENTSYIHFKVSEIIPVQNLMENLIITLLSDNPNKYIISSYTVGLLLLQLSYYSEFLSYHTEEDAIIKMYKYVDENYKNGSLSELCDLLHYDISWFSREIKRKTGKTYTEIVQERRLMQARFLLENADINVSDIAINVGYDNTSYFHRIFSKQIG